MTAPSGRDHRNRSNPRERRSHTPAPPVAPGPHATPPNNDATGGATGREGLPRDAHAGASASRGYPGRDRLDAAEQRFRARLKAVAREAITDEPMQAALAELIDAAVRDLEQLAEVADRALAAGGRHQARIRSEIKKAEQLARRAPAGRARELADAQVVALKSQIVAADLDA